MYHEHQASHCRTLSIRAWRYHLREWGQPQADTPPVVLLHGWMDVSASWQFVVDAWASQRWILAPDWRGFGHSRAATTPVTAAPNDYGPTDRYLPADYLADLDFLLDRVLADAGLPPHTPVDLVGHSMGGNLSLIYAGIRPERVHRVVTLDAFGLPGAQPDQAAGRYARWIDELKGLYQQDIALKTYDSQAAVAARLLRTNPRLHPERAHWLAGHWAAPDAHGRWHVLGDAAHKIINPHLYREDEVMALFTRVKAPVLAIEAEEDSLSRWFPDATHSRDRYHARLAALPACQRIRVPDCGHMVHHDQPEAVARLIADFIDRHEG